MPKNKGFLELVESIFETFLFNCRFLVFIAVIGSLVASLILFLRGAYEVYEGAHMFIDVIFHSAADAAGGAAHGPANLSVVLIAAVDSFLFATVLLIFSMGCYELFISEIDPSSRRSDTRPNWLAIHSLDDLKNSLGKVILMILIVRLFEATTQVAFEKPIDLLFLGLAVALVSFALFLVHAPKGQAKEKAGK